MLSSIDLSEIPRSFSNIINKMRLLPPVYHKNDSAYISDGIKSNYSIGSSIGHWDLNDQSLFQSWLRSLPDQERENTLTEIGHHLIQKFESLQEEADLLSTIHNEITPKVSWILLKKAVEA